MFLIDKYRPTKIKDAYFHKDLLHTLEIISKNNNMPHIIFYGPIGSGKRTIINMFLEMIYDEGVHDTKDTLYQIVSSGNKKTDVKVKQSNYHIVIEPQNNNFDKYLIQNIVKEYAKRQSFGIFKTNKPHRVVLINNIDNMSYYAQTSLRRTMEIYSDKCRFIMWCKSLSRVIAPLRNSRCIAMRIPAPSNDELFKYAFQIAYKEKINLTLKQYNEIIALSSGNIKKTLWYLQFAKYGYNTETNYIQTIKKLIDLIMQAKLENVQIIRNMLYSVMITNYDETTILRDVIEELCLHPDLSEKIKYEIVKCGGKVDYHMVKGRRQMLQFDAFIISTIKIINDEKINTVKNIN